MVGCFATSLPSASYPSTLKASSVSLSAGKHYFEVRVLEQGARPQLGWADDSFEGHVGIGDDSRSWAIDGTRLRKWHSKSATAYGKLWQCGDVVGFAVDLDAKTVSFSLNGSWAHPMGTAFTNITFVGGLRPAFSFGFVNFHHLPMSIILIVMHVMFVQG